MGKTGKQALLPLLLRHPTVVAYVNGHTHHNKVVAYKRKGAQVEDRANAELASLSRRLSINDPQRVAVTERGGAGRVKDRNVELMVKDPTLPWLANG